MGFCSLCKFLGGSNEPGHGLDLETVERKSLPPWKSHPMTGEERDVPWTVAAEAWVSYRGWGNVRSRFKCRRQEVLMGPGRSEKGVVEGPSHVGT